jgi:thymidine kinase
VTGRIEVICGCMFAGKTGRLILLLQQARGRGQKVAAFKHLCDTRYDADHLVAHDGRRYPAVAVACADEVLARSAGVEVVAVDEAQFFGRPLVRVSQLMRGRGQRLILAGIDHDAWGQEFVPLPQLKELADAVEVLTPPCAICGRPARFSQRLTPVIDGNLIGGKGDFEPRCAACFRPLAPPAPAY